MKKLYLHFTWILLGLMLAGCAGNPADSANGGSSVTADAQHNTADEQDASSVEEKESAQNEVTHEADSDQTDTDHQMTILVSDGTNEVIFLLNDSSVSRSLYEQLPLTIAVSDYSSNEKIFYPPDELDTSDVMEGDGPFGTLAYFSPWGNVVMYYSECGRYPGLYIMGEAVEGQENIEKLQGTINVQPVGEEYGTEKTAMDDSELTADLISVTDQITEIEKGFSVAEQRNDYQFDAFLEQGGASSDREVFTFLMEHLLGNTAKLEWNALAFGCSTLLVPSVNGDGYYFGRNFDWNRCNTLVLLTYPENGYASVSTVNTDFIRQAARLPLPDDILKTAAVYAPLDGMNEAGLCVSVNMIQDRATIDQNTDKPDITTTTAIRLLLDQAATTEEAVSLLSQYDMHASFGYMVHFAVADAQGNAVAVEYIGNEMSVIETPVLTNFYLTEGEKYGIGTSQSHTRFEILEETLEKQNVMRPADVRDALSSVSKGNFGEFESTEWSVIFDLKKKEAVYYHRENFTRGWRVVL